MGILRVTVLLAALCAIAGPTWAVEAEGQEESRSVVFKESIQSVPNEMEMIARYPWDHPDEFKVAALGVGALVLLDKPVTKFYQNHIETPLSGFRLPRSPISSWRNGVLTGGADGWLLLGVGGTYLGGVVADSPTAQRAGLQSAKAIAYSYLVSQLFLKSVTGRKRPISWSSNGRPDGIFTDDPYQFGHVHAPSFGRAPDATAMPSFHFTMFFSVAKVYQRAYDNYWVPYSLAAIGLASDIRGHKHWVSDMVAGALVGTAIGTVVTDTGFPGKKGVVMLPMVSPQAVGVQLSSVY